MSISSVNAGARLDRLPVTSFHWRKDLLHALVAAERAGQDISEGEIISTCILMFIGGHGTTMNLLPRACISCLRIPISLRT